MFGRKMPRRCQVDLETKVVVNSEKETRAPQVGVFERHDDYGQKNNGWNE